MTSTDGRTYTGLPVFGLGFVCQPKTSVARELLDLLGVLVRGLALEAHLVPVERGRGLDVARHQPRRLGIVEVRDDEHGRGMLDEAVRHLLEAEPHVLEADLLGDHEERHGRELRDARGA